MTDIPENVDLQWIGRHLIEFRREARERGFVIDARLAAIESRIGRIEFSIDFADLRRRIEALEERGR